MRRSTRLLSRSNDNSDACLISNTDSLLKTVKKNLTILSLPAAKTRIPVPPSATEPSVIVDLGKYNKVVLDKDDLKFKRKKVADKPHNPKDNNINSNTDSFDSTKFSQKFLKHRKIDEAAVKNLATGPDYPDTNHTCISPKVELNSMEIISDIENRIWPTYQPSESGDTGCEVLDYQKLREENLKANQQLFASLGFVNIKTLINTPKPKVKPSQRGLTLKKELQITEPRRSLRIKRIDPQGTPLPEEVVENIHEHRLPSGPITFKDTLYLNKKDCSLETIFFTSQLSQQKTFQTCQGYSNKQFFSTLQKIHISENLVAKVVPGRVFSLAWHPSPEMLITIAGDKYGHIGLWNIEKQENSDMVTAFKPHTKPVSDLAVSPFSSHKLYSCSYDATLRSGDFEKCVFDDIFSVPEEQGDLFRNFDFVDSCNTMLVSQYSGNVSLVDIRSPGTNAESVYQLSKKSLRSVSVNYVKPHYFITAGNDTFINLWDLRFIKPKSAKPIQMLHNHMKSVSSAYFSPSGHKILSSSSDNTILVYSVNENMNLELQQQIKHNNNTGRWLTKFQPKWHPKVEDVFVSGSMNRPREIEVFHSLGTVLRALTNEDHLSSVCSLNVFHPNMICTLVGANSSGRLFVFM